MNIGQIIFSVVYMGLLISYLFSETSGNFKRRAVNKIVMASMFLIYVFEETIRLPIALTPMHILLLAAFTFSYIGDVVLLWNFKFGGASFMLGNLLFFVYLVILSVDSQLTFARLWLAPVVFVLLVGAMVGLYVAKKIKFGKIGPLMLAYLATVTMHGSMSAALLCNAGATAFSVTRIVLMSVGLILFMTSDYFLTVHKFVHEKNWVLRCNSFSYFLGLLLACLSLSF